jgi:hypothetical protein
MRREQLIAPVICLMVISAVMGAMIVEAFGPSSHVEAPARPGLSACPNP